MRRRIKDIENGNYVVGEKFVGSNFFVGGVYARSSILLETILALLFAVMTISAVAGLLVTSMRRVREADYRVRAMLLAENKLAELRTGLLDASKSNEGRFRYPPGFSWSYDYEATEIPDMKELVITITYDDGSEKFKYRLHSLFSPLLHLDSSQLRQLSNDPAKLQSIAGGTGFTDIIGYAEMFPGGDNLLKVFLAGGVPAMTDLFNKLISGRIDPQTLLSSDPNDDEKFKKLLADSLSEESLAGGMIEWSDYDTAGIGEPVKNVRNEEGIASVDDEGKRNGGGKDELSRGRGQVDDKLSAGPMSRQEAMRKIEEMLRRLATHRK